MCERERGERGRKGDRKTKREEGLRRNRWEGGRETGEERRNGIELRGRKDRE